MIECDLIVETVDGAWTFTLDTDVANSELERSLQQTISSSDHNPAEVGPIMGDGAVVGRIEAEVDGSEYSVMWDAEMLDEVYF